MDEQDRAELESLKERQSELLRQASAIAQQLQSQETRLEDARRDLQQLRSTHASLELARIRLSREITQFESSLASKSAVAVPVHSPPPPPPPQTLRMAAPPPAATPPPLPPIIPNLPPPVIPAAAPVPVSAPPRVQAVGETVSAQTVQPAAEAFASEASKIPPPPQVPPPVETPPPRPASFELRLGTYWLVRVGIVMLLTGVVFLGTYAYKNWVGRIGPGGKVILLYLMSGTLMGLGSWLYRKQETLKNYAQVLFAGGLAAAYFTTYGAYHIPALHVIESALLDGALLLAWAAFVVWLADRRKSEVLALFAVGLAFYSSVMTQVGLFTLYSNLILTIAAVFFLVRNRWATLSLATLAASYGGYVFWRFYHGGEWHWASPEEGLWKGIYFLTSYWALFTAAVFTTNVQSFTGRNRAGFLSLNNGAFFTLFLLTMLQVRHGGFWKFALAYGTVLLALAVLAWRRLREDKLCANAYLTQGLVLVTIGFVAHYSGLRLAFILAVESVMLTLSNRFIASRIIQFGAYASGLLSVAWAVSRMLPDVRADLITGAFIGAAMIFNAAMNRSDKDEKTELASTILFTILALVAWFVTTWQHAHDQWRALALAIESLAFVLVSRPLRNFALRHGALPYAAVAVAWAIYTMDRNDRTGLAIGLGIGAVVLLDDLLFDEEGEAGASESAVRRIFSMLALVIWFATTWVFSPAEHRAAILAAEGVLFVAGYLLVKVAPLTYGGLAFIFIAQILCVLNLLPKTDLGGLPAWVTVRLPWWNPAIVSGISVAATHWTQRQKRIAISQGETSGFQLFFVLPFLGILFFWFQRSFSPEAWFAFTALLAICVTVYGLLTRLWVLAIAGQIYIWYSALKFVHLAVLGSEAIKPQWLLALAPVGGFVALSFIATFALARKTDSQPWLHPVSLFYRATAVAISILWVFRYIDAANYIWVLGLLGIGCFAGSVVIRNRELLVISSVYTALSYVIFWSRIGSPTLAEWPNLLVVVGLLVQQVIAQAFSERLTIPREAQVAAILLGLASLWLWVSKWVSEQAGGFYLTATWAALALVIFAAGFVLKERMYRWSGLVVLTCALGRVVLLDVWRLETIYRILSFMALGVVLLVLGFIYTKYQEKIREWL